MFLGWVIASSIQLDSGSISIIACGSKPNYILVFSRHPSNDNNTPFPTFRSRVHRTVWYEYRGSGCLLVVSLSWVAIYAMLA